MSRRLAIILAALAVGTAPAVAQDFTLDPTFGETSLSPGFETYSIDLVAGGDLFASETIGGDCFGLIADAPDFRIQLDAGAAIAISVISDADTTLVVNDPNGDWVCNDDFQELNPAVFFDFPVSGQYDIWVGTFGDTADATLYIDEYTDDMMDDGDMMGGDMMPDFSLDPAYGEVTLSAGFGSQSIDMLAGGPIDAFGALGDQGDHSCFGYIAPAPDYRVFYDGSGPLTISVNAEVDTTLVVNDPNGNWNCDDDSGGYPNPAVTLTDAPSGQYDIWVGTYLSDDLADATLTISEGASGPSAGMGAMPDFSLDPTFGETSLAANFAPLSIDLVAGGDIDAQAVGDDCWGMIAEAPDYRIQLEAGANPVTFAVTSESDTTLVINAPDAGWYCGDDSGDSFNPEVVFNPPMSGQYDIWVGTFFGGTADATLSVSGGRQK